MDDKKRFFGRPSPAEIKEDKEPVILEDKIVVALQELQPHQYAVIPGEKFGAHFNPAKFLKHGETFDLGNRPFGKSPCTLFRDTVSDPQTSFNTYMGGYSFKPLIGPDKVPRRVPFVELLEAARILAYGTVYPDAAVKIEGEYTDVRKVEKEGGSFLISSPSRTQKHGRYRFTISSIPMRFTKPFVYLIPYSFGTQDLGVESKAFRELRYTSHDSIESSRINYVQAHEIAAAYAIAESQLKEKNSIPSQFLVFPIASQQAVDLYTKLLNRTLLQVEEEGKVRFKHLGQAHIEAMMWRLVRRKGYGSAFDDQALLEGRMRNYNWNNHVQT